MFAAAAYFTWNWSSPMKSSNFTTIKWREEWSSFSTSWRQTDVLPQAGEPERTMSVTSPIHLASWSQALRGPIPYDTICFASTMKETPKELVVTTFATNFLALTWHLHLLLPTPAVADRAARRDVSRWSLRLDRIINLITDHLLCDWHDCSSSDFRILL